MNHATGVHVDDGADPHPNPKLRVIGTLSNMPEFQAAFKCAATDKMVRKNACRIW